MSPVCPGVPVVGVAIRLRATLFEGVADAFGAWPLATGVAEEPCTIGLTVCLGAIGIAFRGVAVVAECRDGVPLLLPAADCSTAPELPFRDGVSTG
jgi:hypothetical protein